MNTSTSPGHSAANRLVPLATLLILIAIAALGYLAVNAFNLAVQPELDNRSRLIGTSIRNSIERALALDVPLDQIAGTEHYLLSVMETFPEIARISIRAADGILITEVERNIDRSFGVVPSALASQLPSDTASAPRNSMFRFAILSGNSLAGEVVVSIDRAYVEQQFTDVFLDVIVIALVVLLLAFEVMLATVSTSFSRPLDGLYQLLERQAAGDFSKHLKLGARDGIARAADRFSDHTMDLQRRYNALEKRYSANSTQSELRERLANIGSRYQLSTPASSLRVRDATDIRLALFLFATGEELSKPFLPLLVRTAATETTWISQEVLISLPIVAYLLALILLSPVAGTLAERFTARKVFIAALLPVAISHIGLSLSTSVGEFVLWRGLAGAGYAVATISCQEYALQTSANGHHGRAMGGFVTVVIGGTFCGTALGGVLADRIGTSVTFLIGAALVAVSGLIAHRMISGDEPRFAHTSKPPTAPARTAFRSRRFLGLLFGIAIPANIVMASFLWYVVPLALADLGSRPADIGRVLMVYYLMTILVTPFVARFMDHGSSISLLIAMGGALSGAGLVNLIYWYGLWPILAAVAAAGVGHAMIRATLIPLAIMIAAKDAARLTSPGTLAALRMWERAGSVIGLVATGVLVGRYGYAMTIGMIGALAVAGAFIFLAMEVRDAINPDT